MRKIGKMILVVVLYAVFLTYYFVRSLFIVEDEPNQEMVIKKI